jgi:alanine dehydrogenase
MHVFDAEAVAGLLPYEELIEALEHAFRQDWETPERTQHPVEVPGSSAATLLMMPAWQPGSALGVKIGTVFPDNARMGLPAVHASYILLEAGSGRPLAFMDGSEITLRRTAGASALASRYLSRSDSQRLLMVGTGKLAPHLIVAHALTRDISNVAVWGRRSEAAQAVVEQLSGADFDIAVADDLEAAARQADIICCATLSGEALIKGAWLSEGQHLDLVGAFTPEMQEADVPAVTGSKVFVDTRAGALAEAGDIIKAIDAGELTEDDIAADLEGLVRGMHPGRTSAAERTLFKSVGSAIEDLAAAQLVMRKHRGEPGYSDSLL